MRLNGRPIMTSVYKIVVAGTNIGPWSYVWTNEYKIEQDDGKLYFTFKEYIDEWLKEAKEYVADYGYELEIVQYRIETIESAVIVDRKQVIIERDKITKIREIERRKV